MSILLDMVPSGTTQEPLLGCYYYLQSFCMGFFFYKKSFLSTN